MGRARTARVEIEVPPGVRLACEVNGRLLTVAVRRHPDPPHDDTPFVGSMGPARKVDRRRKKASLAGTLFDGVKEPASGVATLPPPILVLAPQRQMDQAWAVANHLNRLGYHAETRTDHAREAESHGHGVREGEEAEGGEQAEEAAVPDDGLS